MYHSQMVNGPAITSMYNGLALFSTTNEPSLTYPIEVTLNFPQTYI